MKHIVWRSERSPFQEWQLSAVYRISTNTHLTLCACLLPDTWSCSIIRVQDDGEVTAREEAHFFYVLAKLRSGDREALKELEPPGMLLIVFDRQRASQPPTAVSADLKGDYLAWTLCCCICAHLTKLHRNQQAAMPQADAVECR